MATVGVQHHKMFIGGQHQDADESYEIRNPANEELVATVAKGTVEHADAAVAAAKKAFENGSWATLGPDERREVMLRISEGLSEKVEELIEAEITANGATVRQAGGFHIGLAAPHFAYFAELAGKFQAEVGIPTAPYPTLSSNVLRREPIGVCAGILPWNFPLVLTLWKIGPALAAGNSIVIKADEKTPLSTLMFADIAKEAGLPDGVLNIITGDGPEVGARLSSHPDVGKIAFTGSTAVGREIMKAASQTVKKVSLELGGKGAAVITEDVDIKTVADAAIMGCCLYSGQMCESITRLIVPESIHDELVAQIVKRIGTLKMGDPFDFDTDVGPVVSKRQHDRVLSYLKIAEEEGAVAACGGKAPEGPEFEKGFWIEPTVFTNVTNDMRIAREEVFGPVLVVIKYSGDVDEAVAIANDSIYGLSGAVWSNDYEVCLDVAQKLQAGTVWINDVHMVTPELPFGGYKQSGLGRELGPDALNEYTEVKHIHIDLSQKLENRAYDLVLSAGPDED
ncbi:aldehyde dehydrogenase family protein [Patulibacter minatonensis]|uniref:aldehyde dehydrogenase family protein n=1 Tax=Patulibacter minatonensis TaxID=298163 RepID=UPI00047E178F|nr:aldehyde dehydrogenase family protein [Patulibacter minatonensis]